MALWAYKIDCFYLAHKRLYGTVEEQQEFVAQFLDRDYIKLGFAGSDAAQLVKLDTPDVVSKVRTSFAVIGEKSPC